MGGGGRATAVMGRDVGGGGMAAAMGIETENKNQVINKLIMLFDIHLFFN